MKFIFEIFALAVCTSIGSCQPLVHNDPPSFYKFDDLNLDDFWVAYPTPETIHDSADEATTTEEPMTITVEPMTTTVEPETTTVEPETITVEPETTTVEPETTTVEPETTTVEPETTTVEPETTTVEPETTTVELETTTEEPKTTTVEPKTTTVEPETTTEEPKTTLKPTVPIINMKSTKNPSTTGRKQSKFLTKIQKLIKIIIGLGEERQSLIHVVERLVQKMKSNKNMKKVVDKPTKKPSAGTGMAQNEIKAIKRLAKITAELKSENHSMLTLIKTIAQKMNKN